MNPPGNDPCDHQAGAPLPALAKRFFTPAEIEQMATEDPLLLREVALLQIGQLQQRAAQLKESNNRVRQLEKLLHEATKAAARQAAPFRVPEPKRTQEPKGPGRKRGHPGACRPVPEHIDQEIVVKLSTCSRCGSQQWCEQREIEQYIEEIPPVRPRVTRLLTYAATCACCAQEAHSSHPLQTSTATGAARVMLGPQALALAADLNKAKGLTMRKTCAVLSSCFNLKLTPGGLSQALDRVADRLEPQYEQILTGLLQAPALHVDETSWWLGGKSCWLWVFAHERGTFYLVVKSRGREVLEAVLGENFKGTLVSDCLSVYDLESGSQQKCYSHHLKAIKEARERDENGGEGFLCDLRELLKAALELGRQRVVEMPDDFDQRLLQLESTAQRLLCEPREKPSEESVRQRLHKQQDHLFTFLKEEGVDATNNLAERQLRPAVIARKLSCGNKTPRGSRTFQILASIAATAVQTGTAFTDLIAAAIPLDST